MRYRFTLSNRDRVVLVENGKIVCGVEEIPGYDNVKVRILDNVIDNMTYTLNEKGIIVQQELKQLTPQLKNTEVKEIKVKTDYTYGGMLLTLFLSITWIMGVVLAPGWWKLLASFFPPYSWYLLAELIMKHVGLI